MALFDPASPAVAVVPIVLMTIGVAVLLLIGHFVFRRDSEEPSDDPVANATSDA